MKERRTRRWAIVVIAVAVLLAVYGPLSLQAEWLPSYDAERDYAYSFSEPSVRRVPVSVTEGGFTLPAAAAAWDTGIVRMQVSATLLGEWLPPSIEIHVDGTHVATQSFEPGAEGVRFLDLSRLASLSRDGPQEVRLHGRRLSWKPHSSEALFFDNRLPARPRVMVIAPHPDDAEIAAFGLYSEHDSRVVTITAGDSGPKQYAYLLPEDAQHFAMKARLRVSDSIATPELGGVTPEHALNLGYFDGTLDSMFARPQDEVRARYVDTKDVMTFRRYNMADLSSLGIPRATWESLVSDLTRLFAHGRPDVIVAPHPALDGHPDHVFTGIAVLEAIAAADLPETRVYLSAAHIADAFPFPFGTPNSVVGLPPWFDPRTPFHGLRSLPLSREKQILKLFVLESMHELRRGPPGLEPSTRENLLYTFAALRRLVADLVGGDPSSYHRKAARPNELFFVYAGRDACALRAGFLEGRGIKATVGCGTPTRNNAAPNGPTK